MRKHILAVFIFLVPIAPLWAQVIASEDFDYTPGTGIIGTSGGIGWSDQWTLVGGSDKTVVSDSITNYRTGKKSGTALNLNFATDTDNIRFERTLNAPVTDDGGTYWMAFSADFLNGEGGNVMQVILANVAATGASGGAGQLIRIGKVFGGKQLGVDNGGTTRIVNGKTAEGPHWLVAKIEFTNNPDPDTVTLFVDPDPAQEPFNFQADARLTTGNLNSGFDGIMIKTEGAPILNANLDNIILANSYADIIPQGARTIEKYRQVIEKFDYAGGEGINGKGTIEDGWAGPWEVLGTGFDHSIVNDSIINESILKATSSNALKLDLGSGASRIKRPLAAHYKDNGLDYWLSFSADFSNAVTGNVMNVMLVDNPSQTLGAGGPGGQLLRIGKMFNDETIGIDSRNGGLVAVAGEANKAHWFVVKIETSGDADGDTVRVFLNPEPGIEPLAGEETLKFSQGVLNEGWQAIGVKIEGSPNTLTTLLDDIYLALDYQDVIPGDLSIVDSAPLPAFDKFAYTTTDTLRTSEPIGGRQDGWNGPWKALKGETYIATDSIANFQPDVLKTTGPNAMDLDMLSSVNEIRAYRGFETSYPDNGRTYWLGYWAKSRRNATGNVSQILLCDTSSVAASGPGGQLLGVGVSFSNNNIQFDRGAGTRDSGMAGDTSRWVVMKITTTGDLNDEQVKLFIDPAPGTEPDDGEAVAEVTVNTLNNGWNGVMIKHEGPQGLRTIVDNIYTGNSFAEITPDDLIDLEPIVIPGAGYEAFSYEAGTTLEGAGVNPPAPWTSAWLKISGNDAVINAESLDNNLTVIEGGSVTLSISEGEQDTTVFDRKVRPRLNDDGEAIWLSFLMESVDFQVSKSSRLSLLNGEQEIIGFGGVSGLSALGVVWPGGVKASSIEVQGLHWVVVKIELSGSEGADTVRMWIDPEPTIPPEESLADIIVDGKTSPDFFFEGFDGIRLSMQGFTPSEASFDEIRFGISFGDVSLLQEEVDPDLIARDIFAYSPGALSGQGAENDQWAGPWEFVGSEEAGVIATGALEVPGIVGTSNRAVLINDLGNVRYVRKLKTPISDDGNEYWLSALVDFGEGSNAAGNVGQLYLWSDGFNAPLDQRLAIGRTFDNTEGKIGFFDRAAGRRVKSEMKATGSFWLVMKLQMSGDAEADSAWLWINPDPELTDPDLADAVANIASASLNDGFAGIFLKSEGNPSLTTSFDDIRLGTTYSSVTPASSSGGGNPVTGWEDVVKNKGNITNYPNPFRKRTTISYTIEKPSDIKILIVSLQGKIVRTLVDRFSSAGTFYSEWDGTDQNGDHVAQGVYFYRLWDGESFGTRRLVLIND
ncbi:T9SS type A sorting domain-containing protein [Fulvivirga sp. M361]|uniref:T9SS type A sorting domain-containing protein n=1 Tax=Fulvivirga sp. M361 TaxID=2594266 RepID=UPI0016272FCB|nr:T9SS type A sorting domain-containing protein [Fulvivirga sp. M361]